MDVTISKYNLQLLFDSLVQSMDFGSGFLGDEEVEALRNTARLLGVDPNDATPRNFKHKYPHMFVLTSNTWSIDRCGECSQTQDWKAHQ